MDAQTGSRVPCSSGYVRANLCATYLRYRDLAPDPRLALDLVAFPTGIRMESRLVSRPTVAPEKNYLMN